MKLINEIYNFYRDRFIGDEEDVMAIVLSILQEQNREEMLQWINEMQESEIYQMLGLYLMEMLRLKLAEEGLSIPPMGSKPERYH
ncbi:DUF6154 family protein [Aneurinibacillus terranovensis]|uniref:DUF6154 family protein n=1 Tax=Aneurinibacillus terranovensis TaxID=278991 RepID=UPI0003F9077C|nr:DUF6154 family protein [Aneurinibacillus terranovensis]